MKSLLMILMAGTVLIISSCGSETIKDVGDQDNQEQEEAPKGGVYMPKSTQPQTGDSTDMPE